MISTSPSDGGTEPQRKMWRGKCELLQCGKLTNNQITLRFGNIMNQPAEPHREHERGKLASCGQVTHSPQRLLWQLLASCATIAERWWEALFWWGQTAQVVEVAISYLSQQHGPQMGRNHESGNPIHLQSLESLPSWVQGKTGEFTRHDFDMSFCYPVHISYAQIKARAYADQTYSLGLVLTSTLRGPLLLKHCLRRTSTSEKGLRNTRSPFMANNFFPTSRPAILQQNIKE